MDNHSVPSSTKQCISRTVETPSPARTSMTITRPSGVGKPFVRRCYSIIFDSMFPREVASLRSGWVDLPLASYLKHKFTSAVPYLMKMGDGSHSVWACFTLG